MGYTKAEQRIVDDVSDNLKRIADYMRVNGVIARYKRLPIISESLKKGDPFIAQPSNVGAAALVKVAENLASAFIKEANDDGRCKGIDDVKKWQMIPDANAIVARYILRKNEMKF